MTFKRGRVDDVGKLVSAPWAFASWLAEANHGADERRENAGNDNGNSEECAKACAAEHAADDETHGRDNETEEESTEGGFDGRLFNFSGCKLFLWRDSRAARGAKAPRRGGLSAAFLTMVGHWMALPVVENISTSEIGENRTGVTGSKRRIEGRWTEDGLD